MKPSEMTVSATTRWKTLSNGSESRKKYINGNIGVGGHFVKYMNV